MSTRVCALHMHMHVHMYVCSKLTNERESVTENDEGEAKWSDRVFMY